MFFKCFSISAKVLLLKTSIDNSLFPLENVHREQDTRCLDIPKVLTETKVEPIFSSVASLIGSNSRVFS